jgi:hypothetical protein
MSTPAPQVLMLSRKSDKYMIDVVGPGLRERS